MNLAALLKLLDLLLPPDAPRKGRGKNAHRSAVLGRNAHRTALLGLTGAILWNVRGLPEKLESVDKRVGRLEYRLGVTIQDPTPLPASSPALIVEAREPSDAAPVTKARSVTLDESRPSRAESPKIAESRPRP